jgi:hypothetical protein
MREVANTFGSMPGKAAGGIVRKVKRLVVRMEEIRNYGVRNDFESR